MTEDDNYKKQTGNGNDGENYNVNNKDNNNSNIYLYIYIYMKSAYWFFSFYSARYAEVERDIYSDRGKNR